MICPKCGANVDAGTPFCVSCGALIQDQTVSSLRPGEQLSAKKRGLSKSEFIANEAGEGIKRASLISYIAAAVVALLVIICVIVVNTTPIYNLSIVKMAVDEDEIEDLKEITDEAADFADEALEILEDFEDDLDSEELKVVEKYIAKAEKCLRNPSIAACSDLAKSAKAAADRDIDEDLIRRLDVDAMDEIEEIGAMFDSIIAIGYVYAIIVIALAALSAYFKRTVLAVLAMIPVVLYTIILAGFLWLVLIVGALGVLAVMNSQVNKAYKA